jgi:hypothetical protein
MIRKSDLPKFSLTFSKLLQFVSLSLVVLHWCVVTLYCDMMAQSQNCLPDHDKNMQVVAECALRNKCTSREDLQLYYYAVICYCLSASANDSLACISCVYISALVISFKSFFDVLTCRIELRW